MFVKLIINCIVLVQLITVLQCTTLHTEAEDQRDQLFQRFKRGTRRFQTTAFMKTNTYLMTTLKVSDFNETAAEAMINENLDWRKHNNLENIFSENFKDLQKNFPFSLDEPMLHQSRVCKLQVTESNLVELFQSDGGRNKFVRYLSMIMEGMANEVLESYDQEYRATPWTLLANSETYSQATNGCEACIFAWMNIVYMAEKYYTGMMKELVIFEVPSQAAKLADRLEYSIPSTSNVNVTLFGGKQKYQVGKNKMSQSGFEQFTVENKSSGTREIKNFMFTQT